MALSSRNWRPAAYCRETQLFWIFGRNRSNIWQRLVIVINASRMRIVGRRELWLELRHLDLLLAVVHVDVVFKESTLIVPIGFALIELCLWSSVWDALLAFHIRFVHRLLFLFSLIVRCREEARFELQLILIATSDRRVSDLAIAVPAQALRRRCKRPPFGLARLSCITSIKVILVLSGAEFTHGPRMVNQLRCSLLQDFLEVLVAPVLAFPVRFLCQQSQV